MLERGEDATLSLLCSATACILLIVNGWTTGGLLFLACTLYFLNKLRVTPKVKAPDGFHAIIIGSGVSGIAMGRKFNLMGIKYTILEKSQQLGGTWYDNTYPGVACDVPSHLYSYSFFQNPYWTRAYSHGREILSYIQATASRFGVYPHIRLGKRVASATWDSTTSTWTVACTDGTSYKGNILVSCCGGLHVPKLPTFTNMDKFKGEAFHTALWKADFDPKGKRIAIIGTGASAVQAVPALAEQGVASLTVFQRTPCWSPPRLDFAFPPALQELFALVPVTNTIYRWFFFWRNEFRFWALFTPKNVFTKWFSDLVHHMVREHHRKVVKDPELCKKLIPSYDMGCKRITPSDTYLAAFNKENVHLVTESIQEFTETGIRTKDGKDHEVDAIIYATGFDLLQSAKAFKQFGLAGRELSETFQDTPMAYYGITHPDNPNCFWLLGPGTGLGHNSIIFMIECQVDYTASAVERMLDAGAKSMVVKPEKLKNYWDWMQDQMKGMVFADNSACVGWYRNERGVNWTLWPKDLVRYWWWTRTCNLVDYHLKF